MPENDIIQIRINNNPVGVVGLRQVMETIARDHAQRSEDELGKAILQGIAEKNYIPPRAESLYVKALIREFRKFMGQPVEEMSSTGLRVIVLGPGCAQCSRLETDVREVLAEMKLPAALIHETDPREIGKYGVMGVPALVINGQVVCVGTTPHRNRIREWLTEARDENPT